MTDAYQTLGVNKDATDDEIKKAYRKLAGIHHPDKGGDTKKFQEIQTAYNEINTAEKRQNAGSGFHFDFGGRGPSGGSRFSDEDLFRSFFEQPGFRREARKNKDLRVNLHVKLADLLQDTKRKINVQATNGNTFEVDVTIPRGATSGTTIKYTGQGDTMFESLTRGDLYVIIIVLGNDNFDIQGRTVYTTLELDSFEAMLGAEKIIKGIDGDYKLKIPAGCQPNTKLALHGKGYYQLNYPERGDLVVVTKIKTPVLTESQKELLKSIYNNFKT